MPNIRSLVYGELKRLYSASRTFFRGSDVNQTNVGSPSLNFSIKTDIADGAAGVRARMLIYLDESVSTQVLREIGEQAVEIVKDTLSPIRRSGELEDSIQYRIVPIYRIVTIYSDHPAAASLISGYRGGGSYQSIEEWMGYKQEFDGLEGNERNQVAFLIRRAINSGQPPSPLSSLYHLNPVGERRFDFMADSEERIVMMVQDAINDMVAGAGGPL